MNGENKQPIKNNKSHKLHPAITSAIIIGACTVFAGLLAFLGYVIGFININKSSETMQTTFESSQQISNATNSIITSANESVTESTSTNKSTIEPTVARESVTESTFVKETVTETTIAKETAIEATTKPTPVKADFSDNFDSGANKAWEPLSGTWRVINGAYTADPTDENIIAYSMVGDQGWQDYSVDVDVSVLCQAGYPIILLIRSLDPGNGMQMEINCCSTKWLLYKNGTSTMIAEIKKGIPYECGTDNWKTSHIRIEAQGSFYTMYLNGANILQVQDNTYSYGRSGIGLQHYTDCPRFDNFKVSNLP
jgi:hypothetical protein